MRVLNHLLIALAVVLSLSTPALASYSDTVLSDSPEAYWRLGESEGSLATDSSGNGHLATYSGPTLGQPGALHGDADRSVFFDSTDIARADSATLMPNQDSWSVEAWVKVPATGRFMAVVSWYPGGHLWGHNGSYFLTITEQGLPSYDVRDVHNNIVRVTGSTPITDSSWHHLVGVLDRQQFKIRLYVDGKEVASAPAIALGVVYDPSGIPVNLGGQYRYWDSPWPFAGMMDEVALYRGALSAERVLFHYEVGRGLTSDSDGDGVPDSLDQCAGTPAGAAIDGKGCITQCPTKPAEAEIEAAVQEALTALTATLGEKERTISELNAEVNRGIAALSSKEETIVSLQNQAAGLNASLSELQQKVALLQAQVDAMYTKQQLDEAVLSAQQALSGMLQTNLRQVLGDPGFLLPGGSAAERINALTGAIGSMSPGQIKKLQGLLTP